MDIQFERGNRDRPRGHALLFFQHSADPNEVWVSYVVVMPIMVDLAKYVPPFLMNQVASEISSKDLSAFAFPPAPELLEGRLALDELADVRDDDVIYAGAFNPDDVAAAMMLVNDASQQYAELYKQATPAGAIAESGESAEGVGLNEVLYGLMSDQDKLDELSKLISALRFAYDGSDQALIQETESDLSVLADHLPDDHKVPQLVDAVKSDDVRSARLADLYLQRCFHLVQEEYAELSRDEEEIRKIEADG